MARPAEGFVRPLTMSEGRKLQRITHRSTAEQGKAIGDYIRWRNRNASPKTGFAINSKVRHPYQPKAPG